MTPEGLRPIRCPARGKLICEAEGTVVFRCPRCKRRFVNAAAARPTPACHFDSAIMSAIANAAVLDSDPSNV